MSRDAQRFGDSDDETLRYLLSLKIILAADGLHPLEEHALTRGMQLMGVPEGICVAVQQFEVQRARLEDYLPRTATRARARLLVYDAVRLASADGLYADAEREAVARAAQALGVDMFAVRALEGLVQMERVVEQLRRGLLQPE
jgi:uncharacterized tellurite resistance protein B-like protein